jgi:hypothetical protein
MPATFLFHHLQLVTGYGIVFFLLCESREMRDRLDPVEGGVSDERDCEVSNSALAPSRGPSHVISSLDLPMAQKSSDLFPENAAEPEVEPAAARESRTGEAGAASFGLARESAAVLSRVETDAKRSGP